MGTNRLSSITSIPDRGFSLVEVMVATLILTIAVLTLLQGLELVLRQYGLARDRWKGTVSLWNRVERIRAHSTRQTETLSIVPRARPLYKVVIRPPGAGQTQAWEVLHAEK